MNMKLKKVMALALCLAMAAGTAACKSSAAKNAESLINAIGEVSVDSEEAVIAAEEAYKALTDKDRERVENYSVLEEARNVLDIAKVEKLIDDIGEVTVDCEEAVIAAETAIAALTDEQRSAVANSDVLTAAREKLDEVLEAARIEALRQEILGTWIYQYDLAPDICEVVTASGSEYGVSMYDYLDTYYVPLTVVLNDDYTYSITAEVEESGEEYDKLHDASVGLLRELVFTLASQAAVDQGISDEPAATWKELSEILGVGEDEFFQTAYGMSKEAYADAFIASMQLAEYAKELNEEGTYEFSEGKLNFDDEYEVDYTVEGDVMTWTQGSDTMVLNRK